ncbi:hypothetical protein F4815DRAFT_277242 [Daldinia loculata]|uniref:uncharacterized protein n=1 Tax=Daldinia loculata TaxID=103429 RepID=UPI0020C26E0D|nr:uncharacterized protein F4817DRAFT_29693 [Daldinia loculata]KAI1641842.1 hypothetical protein F4817DRAFT_29693 [Daldinia loculata]KAI2777734.1 hypothetical protein F4815DRAFT_277242 [Daldinia loculata]
MATILKPSESTIKSSANPVPYTRLHITPLDESLLSVVVPSSVLPRARNISYHTIETFPDKQYGFVDLPAADADKIKRKLNGAVLRGIKMRIEKAKPESIPEPTGAAGESEVKKDRKKKRKREIDVTPGVELEGRKVKRGWTTSDREMIEEKRKTKKEKKSKEGKKKKRETKSKYTDGPECLFKTKLPDAGISSKDNQNPDGSKKKKHKSGREVVMHEFEKTTKHPSFLKSTTEKSSLGAVSFEDGVGWVDEHGAVVEPVANKRPSVNSSKPAAGSKPSELATSAEDDDTTSSSGSSDDSDDAEMLSQVVDSSDDEGEEQPTELKLDTQILTSPVSILKTGSARPKSSGSTTSLTIKIPPVTPAPTKVHPLEALYKRPKGGPEIPSEAQPFSFFDGDDDDIEEDESAMGPPSQPPMTPFTKQDFEYRNVRSAAPTPDTAHPSRTFNLWPRQGSADDIAEDDEEGELEDNGEHAGTSTNATHASSDGQTPASDFQRQFWESRGDLNRSWRRRRKAVSKEKRYRDNRARAERAI